MESEEESGSDSSELIDGFNRNSRMRRLRRRLLDDLYESDDDWVDLEDSDDTDDDDDEEMEVDMENDDDNSSIFDDDL